MEAVRAANAAFYRAFEARDLDDMSRLWEHTERVVCTHPGWASLRGWSRVSASFFALFQNAEHLQFILTNEHTEVIGDTGWVSVDENILDVDGATTVAALNLFTRGEDGHGSRPRSSPCSRTPSTSSSSSPTSTPRSPATWRG